MDRDRSDLLEIFPKGGIGAEIGVFRGRFSQKLLKGVEPQKLYLIDPWRNLDDPGLEKAWYHKDSDIQMDENLAVVKKWVGRLGMTNIVEILQGTTAEVIDQIPDGSLDFVYIDGDHRYEGVSLDLELSYPKVKDGGFIALDDHSLGQWWKDGVVRATNEFIGAHSKDVQIVHCYNHQVVLQRCEIAKEAA